MLSRRALPDPKQLAYGEAWAARLILAILTEIGY
jgi:hypothetical protein